MNPFDVIKETDKLVAYFSYAGCSVCKALRPKVEEMVGKFRKIEFIYIDTHEHPAVGGQHMVFSAPTIIYFENGREQQRLSRYFSIAELETILEKASQTD